MNDVNIAESSLYEAVAEKADTKFKPGVSGNPNGRPKGTKRPLSKMRKTLSKLYEIEGDAIELIKISMTGFDSQGNKREVDKEKVDMAKFVVKSIESLNNTCLREELAIIGIRDKGNDNAAKELEDNQKVEEAVDTGTFSMDLSEYDQTQESNKNTTH